MGLLTSLLTLNIAHIKKYIDNHYEKDLEIQDQIKYLLKYYPIFALNATFRIASATIAFLFLRSYTIVLLVLYAALLQRILNLYGDYKINFHKEVFKREQGESLFQSFVTNTNLESSFIAKICRKVTFYFNLVFHIIQLLSIYLMCLFVPEDENILYLSDLPIAKDEIWMSVLIFGVIMIGLFSFFLELIFCSLEHGVYVSIDFEEDVVPNNDDTMMLQQIPKNNEINTPWRWWWCKKINVEQYLEDNLGRLRLIGKDGIVWKMLKELGQRDRPDISLLFIFFSSVIDLVGEVIHVKKFLTLNPVSYLGLGFDGDNEIKRGNITNKLFGNAIQQLCFPNSGLNETEDQVDKCNSPVESNFFKYLLKPLSQVDNNIICQERHIYFGIVSLVLIYTPSVNILSSIYGPFIAGLLSSIWGFILLVTGFVLWTSANIFRLRILAAFFGVLGIYLIIVGNIHEGKVKSTNNRRTLLRKKGDILLKALAFPVLLTLSPVILIMLRFMVALKPSSELFCNQSKNLVLIFKGQTKLCLRLYILFVLPSPTWLNLIIMIGLIASNPVPISKMYAEFKSESWSIKSLLKHIYYPIFAANLLSRALAVSVIMVYYKQEALIPMGVYCWILWRITRYCNLHQEESKSQLLEASLFGPVTVTNLQRTKSSKIFRRISSYLSFLTTTVVLLITLQLDNQNNTHIFLDFWYLHLVIRLSIGLGFSSFLADFLYSFFPSVGPVFFKNWRNTSNECSLQKENVDVLHDEEERTVMELNLNHLDHLHENDLEHVKGCLSGQKDVNEKAHNGMTALMIAARNNCPDILCKLLIKGAKINVKDENGKTALTHAMHKESDEDVRILRVWYNHLWHEPRNLDYEMLIAAKKGNARLVCGLTLVGADMESKYEHNAYAYLAFPRYWRRLTLRTLWPLLSEEDEGCTGIHIAARLGHDEAVKTFLSLSPGLVNSEGNKGMTPLALAVSNRRCSTVKLLLEHGAEVDELIVQEADLGVKCSTKLVDFEDSSEIQDLLGLPPLTRTATTPAAPS